MGYRRELPVSAAKEAGRNLDVRALPHNSDPFQDGLGATAAAAAPSGRAVMAWYVTISPSWFDPSIAPPQITPFGMLYAIHDALVRPYPGQKMGPSLSESWQESPEAGPTSSSCVC